MSFFGDLLDFEKFQLGDWWDKIKENPEQLLIGAGDPISAGLWSEITGNEYEPFVNLMGGPYGGSHQWASGLGEGSGVYGRAADAGIDTDAAAKWHDAAEIIAGTIAAYQGGSAAGLWGGGAGGAAGGAAPAGGTGMWGGGGAGGLGGGGGGAAAGGGPGMFGGVPAGAGGGAEGGLLGGGAGGFDWMSALQDYGGLLGGGGGGGGGQQQGPPPMPGIRAGQSSYLPMPLPSQTQDRDTLQRSYILGLLTEPDDDELERLVMGGIL